MAEIHLVDWLIGTVIPGIPSVALGWWAWATDLPGPIIAAISLVVFAVVFIAILVFLGYRAERAFVKPPEIDLDVGRIPIIELRKMAAAAGWSTDAHATVGQNDGFTLANRLRQAVIDKRVNVWGRKYEYDFGEGGAESVPLVLIPSDHFKEFGFDALGLWGQEKNYNIFTNKIPKTARELRGKIFRDLYVDKRQLMAWIAYNKKGNRA